MKFTSTRAFAGLFCLFLAVPAIAESHAGITVSKITQLDQNEPYHTQSAFHDGHLWVGRNRRNKNTEYRVEVFAPNGKLVSNVTLKHTVSYLYPFGTHSVLVVGKLPDPWRTYYSIIEKSGNTFQTTTTQFPIQYQVDTFGGSRKQMFFSEPGEGHVFALTQRGSLKQFGPKIHGPGAIFLVGDSLFVVEKNSAGARVQNLVKINLATQAGAYTFRDHLRTIGDAIVVEGAPLLAATGVTDDKLYWIDTKSNQLILETEVIGNPRGITQLGHCVVTIGEKDRKIRFFDFRKKDMPQVAEWDVSDKISRFQRPRKLSAENGTGRIYVRSNDICPTCAISFNDVNLVEETGRATLKTCTE